MRRFTVTARSVSRGSRVNNPRNVCNLTTGDRPPPEFRSEISETSPASGVLLLLLLLLVVMAAALTSPGLEGGGRSVVKGTVRASQYDPMEAGMLVPVPVDTKALSEAVGLAKPVVETACSLLKSLLGEPCRIAGQLLGDQIYVWQWNNRLRVISRVAAKVPHDKVPVTAMPAGFLIPVLEAVGNVEDDSLQEMWARLIFGATLDTANQHPMFIDVLRRWSPAEAKLFDRVCDECGLGDDACGSSEEWPGKNPALHQLVMSGVGTFQPRADEQHLLSTISMLEVTGVLKFQGTVVTPDGAVPSLTATMFARRLYGALHPRCQ